MLACATVVAAAYLLILTLLSGRLPLPPASARQVKFDVVVPAHDESAVIARTIESLRTIEWPAERWRLIVVADNCSDDTAQVAARAGAQVIERHDERLRAKGYALEAAFERSLREGWADAIAVVDADSVVSRNLLVAMGARVERGAAAVQAEYGVVNPDSSWRTQLMTIALGCFHGVRSRARERLGLSAGIRGNGWCVTITALATARYQAVSLAEDVEFGARLALAGLRVVYAPEAIVRGEMASTAVAAGPQRRRWEGGRFALIRSLVPPLLSTAIRRRDGVCADVAFDLLFPPLSYIVGLIAVLGVLGLWLSSRGAASGPWLQIAVITALAVAAYVARGWQLSGIGMRGFAALARAPVFMVWRLGLLLRWRTPVDWIRTPRDRR